MNIPEDIKKAVGKLSRINLDFLEFAYENPECLDRSNFKLLELHDEIFALQPWPTFINQENQNHFKSVNLKLWSLIKSVPQRVFGKDKKRMAHFYEVPLDTIELQLAGVDDSYLEDIIGRGDFILSHSGLKCLEYNLSANLGGWQVSIWEKLYLNTPLIARFFKEKGINFANENLIQHFLEHLIHSALKNISQEEKNLNFAIVGDGLADGKMSIQSYLNTLYKTILRQKGINLQGHIHMCDYKNLEIVNGFIFYKGEKIHTLVELYRGFVPDEIMTVFKNGNIRIMNGPVSRMLGSKLNLALLSDHESVTIFNTEEKKFIDQYVPWTRKVMTGNTCFEGKTIDLLDFIRTNRHRLVLKPGSSYGGKGVCVGTKTSDHKWQESIEIALQEKNWVVQEYIDASPGLYQVGDNGSSIHDMSWGFFMFGSRCAGLWLRVMPREGSQGVINCHQGARVSVVFNVNE